MTVLAKVAFYFGGSLILLAVVLWLLVTAYFYLLHRRYAHIPSPKMPRYLRGNIEYVGGIIRHHIIRIMRL